MRPQLSTSTLRAINASIGACFCAALAAFSAMLFSNTNLKVWLPIVFIAVLLLTSARFGAISGLMGSVAAALIFAYFLFAPIGSLRVELQQARDNLGWMLLLGIPASYFVAATRADAGLHKP